MIYYIIINYNNSIVSKECINSIIIQSEKHKVFIADNNSNDKEKDILNKIKDKNIEIIYLNNNIGYFPAINEVFIRLAPYLTEKDYVVIGNNDLIFDKNFESTLKNKRYKNDVFIVSPDIININNNHQNPAVLHKYSKLQLLYLNIYHSNYWVACGLKFISRFIKYRSSQKNKKGFDKSGYISIGYGACYIITSNYISKIKNIPNYLFLMNEESALSDIVFRNGGRIYYDKDLIVHHQEHSSITQIPSLQKFKIEQTSYRISKLHFNNSKIFDKEINL